MLAEMAPPSSLEIAILRTIAYADVFDYPLTAAEIHRYLAQLPSSLEAVRSALESSTLVPRRLSRCDEFFCLPGREHTVETRLRRAQAAARMWPRALRYGRIIAQLPFVRMVAVTGALAMDNVEPGDDIDYFIVTAPGRLWFSRAMVVALVKMAALLGDRLCPNYLLSERVLILTPRNFFVAHEIAQMVPLAGMEVYRRLRRANAWTSRFLPNAEGAPVRASPLSPSSGWGRLVLESVLSVSFVDRLERWEMQRKIRKLSRKHPYPSEVVFSADCCKGHFDSHGRQILAAFARRLKELEGDIAS